MEGKMKVAVMNGIGKMGFTERDIPTPKDDEVLVKLDYVGICGSDLHYYESGAIGDYVVEPPFVLGHEPGGVVVEVGKDVKHLKVGDKVALEPGKTCGHCEFCKQGKYNLCPDVVFFATPPVDGVFQEYVAHEADLCFKLPENVSTLEGALIEPLAVGFHAAIQGDAHLGQKAVVMGAGCIGLVSMMALKARGVSEVYVVDIMEKRLEKALELGATGVINGAKEDVIAKAQEALKKSPAVPCTACRYCCDGCPMGIAIPDVFKALNTIRLYGEEDRAKNYYKKLLETSGKAEECLQCGQCESVCPQHLPIIDLLKEASEKLDVPMTE